MSSPRIAASFPLPDTAWPLTAAFWSGASRGELCIPRCQECEHWVWYPSPICPWCGSSGLGWVPTAGRGTLYTWTVVRHVFLPAFANDVPYIVGLVVLEESPRLRVAARILADPDELRIDLPLVAEFRALRFPTVDDSVSAPFFRPATTSE